MACSNGRVLAEGYSESKYAMKSSTMRLSAALFDHATRTDFPRPSTSIGSATDPCPTGLKPASRRSWSAIAATPLPRNSASFDGSHSQPPSVWLYDVLPRKKAVFVRNEGTSNCLNVGTEPLCKYGATAHTPLSGPATYPRCAEGSTIGPSAPNAHSALRLWANTHHHFRQQPGRQPFSANACIAPRAKVALRMPPPEMHRALRGASRSCIFRKRSCSVSAAHSVFSRRARYSSVSA